MEEWFAKYNESIKAIIILLLPVFTKTPNTDFYLPDIVNQSFNPIFTLRENIDRFQQNVIPRLESVLAYKRVHFPENYRTEYIQSAGRPLSIVFAGIEQDSIVFHIRYFNIFSHDPIRLEIRHTKCPGNCNDGKGLMLLGNLSRQMKDWFDNHADEFWRMEIVDGMRKLIEVAIRYDSTEAAHPINVIQISKTDIKWIDPKPPCADDQQKIIHTESPKLKSNSHVLAITLATVFAIVVVIMLMRKKKTQHIKKNDT